MKIETIALNKVVPSPFQTKAQGNGSLAALVESIKENGLLSPIKVRPVGEKYELVFGDNRTQAARKLGWKEISAVVEKLTDREAQLQQIAENLARDDYEPLELAHALDNLRKTGMTQEEIAASLGMTEPSVRRFLQLLVESTKVQALVSRGDGGVLPAGKVSVDLVERVRHSGIEDPKARETIILIAAKHGMTGKQAEMVAATARDMGAGRGAYNDEGTAYGKKAVARYLSLPKEKMLEDVGNFRPTKRPLKNQSAGVFKWFGQPVVLRAEAGIGDVSTLVSTIERFRINSKAGKMQDVKGAKDVLMSVRRLMVDTVKELDFELGKLKNL